MLTYFHKNKLRYEKGQLAPFFILILVVLLVMAMVTVNLSKVAFIKTDSSNAVDSGALAAGSVVANVFNAVASANSQMEALYWEFYWFTVTPLFIAALVYLTAAYTSASAALTSAISAEGAACGSPCAAVGLATAAAVSAGAAAYSLNQFWWTTTTISVSVTAFSVLQHYYYLSIRDMAKRGREQAIELGHRFAFINSGIGSKLKEESPGEEITEQEQKNNYRNEFSRFLDKEIGRNPEYTYPWEDGQEREHFVYSKVAIDEVDTFDLKVAVLPSLAVSAFLFASSRLANSAQASLTSAGGFYGEAEGFLTKACTLVGCCPHHPCCAAYFSACAAGASSLANGIAPNSTALSPTMTAIFPLMFAAWTGLLPGRIFTSSSDSDAALYIITWIDDIMDPNNPEEPHQHNRLVRVDTEQHHEGADLGLWQTRYPDTKSYSVVNFKGTGKIHAKTKEDLRHDPSIIDTDKIGSTVP